MRVCICKDNVCRCSCVLVGRMKNSREEGGAVLGDNSERV